jgi:outer membrane protein OmpA-like peptidoglycan-associated protein
MFMIDKSAMRKYLFTVCVLMLAGCAVESTAPDTTTANASVVRAGDKDSVQEKVKTENTLTAAERTPDYATMNPVPIVFDKFTVKLDENNKHILEQIGERAKKARKLLITGYCDRHQIGNANAAAIARAKAVRDELVRLGVPIKNVRIKHLTNVPGKHAADIEF